jgi:hypothetical protein
MVTPDNDLRDCDAVQSGDWYELFIHILQHHIPEDNKVWPFLCCSLHRKEINEKCYDIACKNCVHWYSCIQ